MASPSVTTSLETLSQIEAETGKPFEEAVKDLARTSNRRVINILATGKHAAGKSALVNGLVGEEVAPENDSLDPGTTKIVKYSRNIDGIFINVWDSPGLEADTEDETVNVEMIAKEVPEADLLLFCIRMDESRLRKQDLNTIIHFTKAFGEEVWRHTVFAMTFANMVVPVRSKDNPVAKKTFFDDRLKLWTEELKRALMEAGVTREIVEKVNIVPVGYYSDPSLPNGQENWLIVFWLVCLHAIKKQAQPALLKVNLGRLKSVQDLEPMEDYALPFYRRPIIVDTLRKAAVPGATGLVGGVIGLTISGPVGMAVGGVVGAVAGCFFQGVARNVAS
jgi:predicted GTPase